MQRKNLEFLAILAGAGLLILVLLAFASRNADDPRGVRPIPTARPERNVTFGGVLSRGQGGGDDVGGNFDVPDTCPRQVLEFSGRANDPEVNVSWVHFAAVAQSGATADSSGPHDLLEASDGSTAWSLSPGRYAIETTAGNARWQYALECR